MTDFDSLATRYLLGELDEEELEATELRLEEAVFFERVRLAEDSLIDAYLVGELDDARRRRFEQFFLRSAARQQRFQVSRLLMEEAQRQQPRHSPRRPVNRLAWAVAVALVAVGAGWVLVLRQEPVPLLRATPEDALLVTLDLGVQRSDGSTSYPLSGERRALRIRIHADPRDLGRPVEVVVRDGRGQIRWQGQAEATAESTIDVLLPGGLPAGAYELEALAMPPAGEPTPIGYSYFDLEKP